MTSRGFHPPRSLYERIALATMTVSAVLLTGCGTILVSVGVFLYSTGFIR